MSVKSIVLASLTAALLLTSAAAPARAEFALEDEQDGGILNPADFSFRAYREAMNRFPDRVGMICVHAYELDKAGRYDQSLEFFTECARHGNPPAMLFLSYMYDEGHGVPRDPVTSTGWIRKAAEAGYQTGQYHYGMALLNGYGTATDIKGAKLWLERAAEQGDVDAARVLRTEAAFHPRAAIN